MDVDREHDSLVAGIAAAIGEQARARMLYALLDGHARTSTELAIIAEVSPSTASTHLARLRLAKLIDLRVQGKHRYYALAGRSVARILEGLSVLAGAPRKPFQSPAPTRLRYARTCYDHIAGALGVALHDRFTELGWLAMQRSGKDRAYDVTDSGIAALRPLGVDPEELRGMRRRFAFACLDWSERRPHLGGALGAALLKMALNRRWIQQEGDDRALVLTRAGRKEMFLRFGIRLD